MVHILKSKLSYKKQRRNIHGDPEKQYQKGLLALQNGQFPLAIIWFKRAAEQRHAPSHLQLAQCYLAGTGVKKDQKLAQEHFNKASELDLSN